MKTSVPMFFTMICLILSSCATVESRDRASAKSGIKHSVGVVDVRNSSSWAGHWNLSNGMTAMMESALFETERFVVVDRGGLGSVMKEQDLQASGRTAQAKKTAETGKIRSAKYLASAVITQAEEKKSGGDAGISIRGIRVGGGKSSAQVTVTAKLVDTTTGEIVAQENITGKAGRLSGRVGVSYKGVGTEMGGFEKTPMGEAVQDCVNQIAELFADKVATAPIEGSIVKMQADGRAIINRGEVYGVEVGDEWVAETKGEELIDPETGEVLGVEPGGEMGRLRVTKVTEKISFCDVVESNGDLKAGTSIRVVP